MAEPAVTVRYERLPHTRFVTVPFRQADGSIVSNDVYREDRLQPDPPQGNLVYLVLDFAEEWTLEANGQNISTFSPSGGLAFHLQAIDNETGEGLAQPHTREYKPDVSIGYNPEELSTVSATGGREYSTKPLTGLTHLPVSPRRD